MQRLVDEDMHTGIDRAPLLDCLGTLVDSIDDLWRGVQQGVVSVGSVPLLRVIKDITCWDLHQRLREPHLQHARILRDLRLFVNTMDYLIVPKVTGQAVND
jgi:hypothetical protein